MKLIDVGLMNDLGLLTDKSLRMPSLMPIVRIGRIFFEGNVPKSIIYQKVFVFLQSEIVSIHYEKNLFNRCFPAGY